MKLTAIRMSCHVRGVLCVLTTLALVLGATRPASATWRSVDAQNAWQAYQNAFLHTEPDGFSKYFATAQGTTAPEGFWTFAEEIEVAEDAYYENPTTTNKNLVQALCDGFIYLHGDDWSSDVWNDDLDVAIIAMARAYNVTGTTRWLTDAENNFGTVWGRAQEGDGGLCEKTVVPANCYQNSSVNWTFVIAGRLLYAYSGTTSYKTDADSVYNNWAMPYLYQSSTGQINDGCYSTTNCVGPDYSYNYGFAIGAMNEESASATTVTQVATYLFNSMSNTTFPYDGTSGGYNILPDYGQGNLNNSGFNGITMRWLAIANGHGLIGSTNLAAAQANLNQAWSIRDGSTELVWNDWSDAAGSGTTFYSWDCSAALAGLLDIPPTA